MNKLMRGTFKKYKNEWYINMPQDFKLEIGDVPGMGKRILSQDVEVELKNGDTKILRLIGKRYSDANINLFEFLDMNEPSKIFN